MENNLIYEYCTKEKVSIQFDSQEQLEVLHGLFGNGKEPLYLWGKGGWVSYTHIKSKFSTTTMHIGPHPEDGYILLTADEFFTLALPDKSILESIK